MKTALVVTTIAAPNRALAMLAEGAQGNGWDFIAIGDTKSPARFDLAGCRFYSVAEQLATGLAFAQSCPTRHYARKNIGYLLAMRDGAEIIVETDDDNLPRPGFFSRRARVQTVGGVAGSGWVNAYGYFSDANLWPRGLPLDAVRSPLPPASPPAAADCPIQQGLADENPDVDAIYRLTLPLPQNFRSDLRLALGRDAWCPFNSQNTAWWREAFPLMYLPAYCSFRMTDIWRSFVAQRIAWERGWQVLFHEATVWQERNEHDIMKDFADEVPGYLNNRRIGEALAGLALSGDLAADLRACWGKLVEMGLVGGEELPLLETWLQGCGLV
jgi:hypothetical protein